MLQLEELQPLLGSSLRRQNMALFITALKAAGVWILHCKLEQEVRSEITVRVKGICTSFCMRIKACVCYVTKKDEKYLFYKFSLREQSKVYFLRS